MGAQPIGHKGAAAVAARDELEVRGSLSEEEARERARVVEAAQRDVAETFKQNQEKERRARLAREAAEKEKFARLAKETREKIDEERARQLAAEKQAALNLQNMKDAEFKAKFAAHQRQQRMDDLQARNAKRLQQEEKEFVKAWHEFEKQWDVREQAINRDRFADLHNLAEVGVQQRAAQSVGKMVLITGSPRGLTDSGPPSATRGSSNGYYGMGLQHAAGQGSVSLD